MADSPDSSPFNIDPSLISAVRQGSDAAFSQIVSLSEALIGGLVSRFDVPESVRDDLRQEALIGLYKAVLLFDPARSSFSSFAWLCMRTGILSFLRRTRNEGEVAMAEEASFLSGGEDPAEVCMGKEELSELTSRIFSLLSEKEEKIFGLRLQGLSRKAIAERLAMPQKSVDNALCRCRKKIRDFLADRK